MKTCWSIISTIVLAVLVILLIAFGGVRLFGLTPYMVTSEAWSRNIRSVH